MSGIQRLESTGECNGNAVAVRTAELFAEEDAARRAWLDEQTNQRCASCNARLTDQRVSQKKVVCYDCEPGSARPSKKRAPYKPTGRPVGRPRNAPAE
jgi:hypothetical protein